MSKKITVLTILDGWGVAPDNDGNAITKANLPNFQKFLSEYPVMTLFASGNEVGLMSGEMGNSEVGHLNIGAGRVYFQSLPRINKEIFEGSFFTNKALLKAMDKVKENGKNLHLIGLIGPGRVHSSQEHLHALLDMARKQKVKNVFIHVILDGRDAIYNSGINAMEELQKKIKEVKCGKIASISGRFYAMDRDNQWERTALAYRAIVEGKAEQYYKDPLKAIEESYAKEVFDEEFVPIVIGKENHPVVTVEDDDAIIFFNFRADRARQLTKAIILPGFSKFERTYKKGLEFVTMTEYEKDLPVAVAYPPQVVHNSLAEVISKAGLKQIHIAETQKFAHVTFFLNGTIEEPFPGEDRKIIPSKKIANYKDAPEMSAREITKEVIKAIESDQYDFIVVNFANPDMVGHSGDLKATIEACEVVDECVGKISDHVLAHDGVMFITADHGNAEEVTNLQTGEIDKEHSTNPVPFFIVGNQYRGQAGLAGDPPEGDLSLMSPVGILADIAPTILKVMKIEQPPEMNGRPLI